MFSGVEPPSSGISVAINRGAEFTNDRDVIVRVAGGTLLKDRVELANNGGFARSKLFPAGPSGFVMRWRLATTAAGRLPKTVYAREAWGPWRGQPATDAIALDETRPVVLAAARVRGRARVLRVRARDRVSGVARVQVTGNRRRPGRWRR